MLYRISPFFKSLLRRTETTDTRQAIRREETTLEQRKKGEDDKRASFADSVADDTQVSVDSLVSFLNDMLKENTATAQEQSFSSMAENITDPETPNTAPNLSGDEALSKTPPSQAANAYQSTASNIEAPNYAGGNKAKLEDGAHAVILDTKDRQTLERFVSDLRELSRNGIESLNISRAGTFFESLREAIDSYKTS